MYYKGWVPTVNGRLSFKLIGETRYPSEPEFATPADTSHLYVVARQSRQLSDVLFEPLLGRLLGYSGNFEFILCARSRRAPTSPDSKLIGRVFLFHKQTFAKRETAEVVTAAIRSMQAFDLSNSAVSLQTQYVALAQKLASRCDLFMDVVLNRDGVITLSHLNWPNRTLAQNTNEHARITGTDLDHSIADQIYFFVRDLTHQHQHHSNDADTIITTQPQTKPNDMSWCLEIMYSLYFHVITVKRKENTSEHVRALGILAYLQSYKNIIERRRDLMGVKLDVPKFDDASTKESIKATKDYIDLRISERKRDSDLHRTIVIWIVATFFTMFNFTASFADKNIKASENIISAANFLKTHTFIFPSLAILAFVYLMSNFIIRPRYDFKRDVVRLSFSNRVVAIWIILVLGAGFLALALYFGYQAIFG